MRVLVTTTFKHLALPAWQSANKYCIQECCQHGTLVGIVRERIAQLCGNCCDAAVGGLHGSLLVEAAPVHFDSGGTLQSCCMAVRV